MTSDWNDIFEYREGALYWIDRYDGKRAGLSNPNNQGYIAVWCEQKQYLAHRIIWEMHNGPIERGMEVDHINQVKHDNRIENLRVVTRQKNMWNTKAKGWFVDPRRAHRPDPYTAKINIGSKQKIIGNYATAEEAHAAYTEYKTRLINE
jgi:hypothetical protein